MKKRSLLAMAMVLTFVSNTALPVEAASNCNNGNNLTGARIIVNGQEVDQSELKNILDNKCSQYKNGSTSNCPSTVSPDCNQSVNGAKVVIPGCNQSVNGAKIVIPGCNQSVNGVKVVIQSGNQSGNSCKPSTSTTEEKAPATTEQKKEQSTEQTPSTEQSTQKPSTGGTSKPDTDQPSSKPETTTPDSNAGTTEEDTKKPETDSENLSYAEQVVKLVNVERAKVGLHALTIDTGVTAAANIRAKEIVTSFSHTRPDGRKFSTVLTDNGIRYTGAGENIAWGQRSPEEVVSAWMNSEGHRANILNAKYTKIGVGYLNASGRNYWVQLFTY